MKITKTIIRDTNYSFFAISKRADGKEFSRKYEKGTTEYSNACSSFHAEGVEIIIGNEIQN